MAHARRILLLVETYGRETVAQALAEAVELGAYGSDYLHILLAHRRASHPETTSPKLAALPACARLQENLHRLRLTSLLEHALAAAEEAARNGQGHLQFLDELLAGEVARRQDRSVPRRLQDARSPVIKTLAGWDWSWPTKLNRMQVEHRLELDFLPPAPT